jgi:hypothetical protein
MQHTVSSRLLRHTPIVRMLAVAAVLALPAGCGGGDEPKKPKLVGTRAPTVAEARDIGATIGQLEGAAAHRDAPAVCRLYTERARETETLAYATCATAVRSDLRRASPPKLALGTIEVRFDRRVRPPKVEASVAVTSSGPGRDPFQLHARMVQERGAWRIEDPVARYLVRSP